MQSHPFIIMKNLLIILVLLSSCNLEKQALKHLHKAEMKSPLKVAEYCAKNFPVVITSNDTITQIEYDSIIVDCSPVKIFDTITKRVLVSGGHKKIALQTKTIYNTITKYVKDSAAVQHYKLLLDNCVESSALSNQKMDRKSEWIKWLLIALGISVILNILFITNKK